jgi:hypothetical protein
MLNNQFRSPINARPLLDRLLTPLGLASIAVALTLPALAAGVGADDYFHRMVLMARGPLGAALSPTFDLFSFVPEEQRATMTELGAVPWWSDPALKIALARPLSALTHRLDHALWPDNFVLQHLHSLLWFGLGVALVAGLYRRIHGAGPVAAMAALLYAVEDAHSLPATWLANRNSLLCLVFGAAAIHAHLAWRESSRRVYLFAALLALGLGLGAGEAAIGCLAYVAAWQITEERRSWVARLLPLIPYILVVAIWRVAYDAAGYGTVGSGLYVDPGREPVGFVAQLLERWPLLISAQWLQAPIDVWLVLSPARQHTAALFAMMACVGLAVLLFDLARRDRLSRFWLLGMSLALVPVCAAFPMDRLLVFAGLGAFGALARLLQDLAVWPFRTGTTRGWRRPVAIVLLVLHLPVAAFLLSARTALFPEIGRLSSRGAVESPKDSAISDQTLIHVNGNDFLVLFTWIIREVEADAPNPRRLAQLSSLFSTQTVRREDGRTLVIGSSGGFLRHSVDRILASRMRTFHVGERIERADFTAEVRSITSDGRPREVAFIFRRDLEDPSYRFLHWVRLHPVPFPLPVHGESVTLSGLID